VLQKVLEPSISFTTAKDLFDEVEFVWQMLIGKFEDKPQAQIKVILVVDLYEIKLRAATLP
jgi:hypothetical protein